MQAERPGPVAFQMFISKVRALPRFPTRLYCRLLMHIVEAESAQVDYLIAFMPRGLPKGSAGPRRESGFNLVELLVVIAITLRA